MGRISLTAGTRYCLNGEWFVIKELLLNQQFLVENQSLGGKFTKPLAELERALLDGSLKFEVHGPHVVLQYGTLIPIDYSIKDFDTLKASVREEAWRRYTIIRPILDWPPHERTRTRIEEYVKELRMQQANTQDQHHLNGNKQRHARKGVKRGMALSRASVMRWLKRYIDSGQDIRALVDKTYKAGAPGVNRLNPDTDKVISDTLDLCEKHRSYRTVDAIYLMTINRVALENRTRPDEYKIQPPSKPTVYNRIHARGAEILLRRRRNRAEQKELEAVQAGPQVTRILQEVEFDGTGTGLFVVDDDDRLPIGAAMISFGLDKLTAYPLGFHYAFEPLGYASTMMCALNSFSPKPDIRKLYGTENLAIGRGLPELARIDDGSEYLNKHMLEAFGMLGILVDQCPVFSPWYKGSIEEFIKTNKTALMYQMPGAFSSILELAEFDPAKYACISKSAFVRIMHIFHVDIYAQQWHRGVGGIPAKLWTQNEAAGFIPTLPSSYDELRILLFRNETRTLQRIGIEFENLVFQNPDAIRMRTLLPHEECDVTIRINPYDLTYIFVLDPITKSEWLKFYAQDTPGYTPGISLCKHRLLVKILNREKREVNVFALAEAKAKIQKIIDEEYHTTRKMRTRMAGARHLEEHPSATASLPDSVVLQGMSLAPKLSDPEPEAETTLVLQGESDAREVSAKTDSPIVPDTQPTGSVDLDQPPSNSMENGLEPDQWASDYHLPLPQPYSENVTVDDETTTKDGEYVETH